MTLTRQRPNAAVVTPARSASGGLGHAAAQAAHGWQSLGWDVSLVRPPERRTLAERMAGARGVRRFGSLARAAGRAAVRMTDTYDACYVMPGFLKGEALRTRTVLHQATRHPQVVLRDITAARRRTGGGRGFLSLREAERANAEIARADVVRTESRLARDDLIETGVDPAKIVVAPPGVHLERFVPPEAERDLLVCYIGLLSLWKGLDQLVRLSRRLPEPVAVVGGPACPWSRRQASIGLFRAFPGQVVPVLQRSRFLVLPSVSDGYGYVALEAMACGTVPIVTEACGVAELVAELHPSLVLPVVGFADAAEKLVDTLDHAALAPVARRLAERHEFSAASEAAMRAVTERLDMLCG